MKLLKYISIIAVLGFILVSVLARVPAVQDRLMLRFVQTLGSSTADLNDNSLSAVVCGSRSPLPSPGRAQTCILVNAGGNYYVVDIGDGSASNLNNWRIDTNKIKATLLTHLHSDHISDLADLHLMTWVNSSHTKKEGLKSPEHRSRHALGRVPVLEDGDISIFESGAIIDYVLERHKNGGLKPSSDSSEFPFYLQWYHYCEGMVMPPMNQIVVQTILLPPDRRDETVLNQAKNLLTKSLAPVNENLADKDYLIGDFSAADLMLGHSCFMANRLGCVSEEMQNIKER